jgi:GNAT superfamily N-acetyltransferase
VSSAPAIRDARPADLPAILQMVRDLAEFERMAHEVAFDPDEFGRHLFGPDPVATVNIAEVDDEVAGMALWFRTFSTFLGKPGIWLEDLYVHPRFRGLGVGGALLRHLRSLTDGRVEWNVLDWNTDAIAAYDAIGATPDEGGWIPYRWSPS